MPAPLTRAQADAVLVGRCRAAGVDLSGASPNPDTTDPLAAALAELGAPPASWGAVTDADLARLAPGRPQAQLLDLAELRLLGTLVSASASRGTKVQYFNQYMVDKTVGVTVLRDILRDRLAAYRLTWVASSAAESGPMCGGGVDHPLDTRFGAWPYGGSRPV